MLKPRTDAQDSHSRMSDFELSFTRHIEKKCNFSVCVALFIDLIEVKRI